MKGRPRGSSNVRYHAGWRWRDIEIVRVAGMHPTGEIHSGTGRPRNATHVVVRHAPCGAERTIPGSWVTKWVRQQVRSGGESRARPWCTCKPLPDARGYVRAKGRRTAAHRVVMEAILGRPLFHGESVHHRNGDRSDNRPENLELWVVSQPAGQRVADIVEHAVNVLGRYAPGLLVPMPEIDRVTPLRLA